jgi:hypothetical protein
MSNDTSNVVEAALRIAADERERYEEEHRRAVRDCVLAQVQRECGGFDECVTEDVLTSIDDLPDAAIAALYAAIKEPSKPPHNIFWADDPV